MPRQLISVVKAAHCRRIAEAKTQFWKFHYESAQPATTEHDTLTEGGLRLTGTVVDDIPEVLPGLPGPFDDAWQVLKLK